MSIPTFTLGEPPDGSSLGSTKVAIRNNIDGTFQTLNVDHVNNNGLPGSNPPGYHLVIHQVKQTATPGQMAGVNQIFAGDPAVLINPNTTKVNGIPSNGDTQLFALTGGGGFSQLTGNSSGINGYQWIGGVLIQWGFTTVSAATPVTFPVVFPNNCYNVQVTNAAIAVTAGAIASSIVTTVTLSQFSFVKTTTGAVTTPGIYWMAIGN